MKEAKLSQSRPATLYSRENQAYFDKHYVYEKAPALHTASSLFPSPSPTNEILGSGENAIVRYARRDNAEYVAVKEPYRLDTVEDESELHIVEDESELHIVEDEIKALQRVSSPHVIKLQEVIRAEDSRGKRQPYLVTEYAPFRLEGEVRQSLLPAANWQVNEKHVWSILAGVFQGTRAIHRAGLIHGGIAMRNVVVGADGKAKLADLGSCQSKDKDNPTGIDARDIYALGSHLFDAVGTENISPRAKLFLKRAEALEDDRAALPSMFGLKVFLFFGNRLKTKTGLPQKQSNV